MVRNKKKFENYDHEPVTRGGRPRVESEESARFLAVSSEPKGQAESVAGFPVETPAVSYSPNPSNWMVRSGHLLSFFGVFLFTVAVYVRPYELITELRPLSTMAFWIALVTILMFLPTQLSLEGNLSSRPREVNILLLLCLCVFLSIPFADEPGNSLNSLVDFMKVVVIFIVMINVIRSEHRWKLLVMLLLLISCFLGFSALRNYGLGMQLVEGNRVKGSIGNMFENPNDLALHLVTMVPIAIGLFFSTRNPLTKLFYLVCGFLMIAGIVVTFSRGGILGLICAVGVLGWKLMRRNRLLAVGAIVILGGGLLIFAPGGVLSRFRSVFDQDQASSISARKDDLKRSILVTLRHPLFGVGIGNFLLRSNRGLATHNAYTQVSAELGIAALVFYVMFIIIPIKRLRAIERDTLADRKKSRFHYLAIGMQASLIGYMVCSLFASVAFLWYVYYLVALSVCLGRLYEIEQGIGVMSPRKPGSPLLVTTKEPRMALS